MIPCPGRVSRPQVQVEDFKDAELMLDITEHTLVPEHKVGGRMKVRSRHSSVLVPKKTRGALMLLFKSIAVAQARLLHTSLWCGASNTMRPQLLPCVQLRDMATSCSVCCDC